MQFQAGSVGQYVKTIRLRHEWTIKQEQVKKHTLKENFENSGKEHRLSLLRVLIGAGKRLTPEEKAYLRKHDPKLYQQVVTIEEEQRLFKRTLSTCKSKEEANGMYFSRIGHFADQVSRISKGGAPSASTGSALDFIGSRAAATNETLREFKKSYKYSRLPDKK
jgi:hypothetical protein